jgi:transposase-like protein
MAVVLVGSRLYIPNPARKFFQFPATLQTVFLFTNAIASTNALMRASQPTG